jgi:hypothetical protein
MKQARGKLYMPESDRRSPKMKRMSAEEDEDYDEDDENGRDDISGNVLRHMRAMIRKRMLEVVKSAIQQPRVTTTKDATLTTDGVNENGGVVRLFQSRPVSLQPRSPKLSRQRQPPKNASFAKESFSTRESTEDDTHLASATLAAIRWLHDRDRLTTEEKFDLTRDVISANSNNAVSKAEMAYMLLVGYIT